MTRTTDHIITRGVGYVKYVHALRPGDAGLCRPPGRLFFDTNMEYSSCGYEDAEEGYQHNKPSDNDILPACDLIRLIASH